MRLSSLVSFLALGALTPRVLAKDHTVSVYTWPFDAKSPSQLASISYNTETLSTSVSNFSPPSVASGSEEEDVRVGLWDPKWSTWRGVMTTMSSFDASNQAKLMLHVDEDGEVWHVAISSYGRPKQKKSKKKKQQQQQQKADQGKKAEADKPKRKNKRKIEEEKWLEPILVEVVKPVQGPSPVLNKPVVLNADGKSPEKDQEKTFLQKYWWAIAIFLAVQLLIPGGEKK